MSSDTYIFQTKNGLSDPAEFTPEQKRLSNRMQQAWVSFARDGVSSIAGEEAWTHRRPGRVSIKNFDTSRAAYVSDFTEYYRCSFWSSL